MASNVPSDTSLFEQLVLTKLPKLDERPAVQTNSSVFTYGDLKNVVETTIRLLIALGAKQGDRIALNLGNSPEYIVAFLAVTALGCIVVPVDPRAGKERTHLIQGITRPRISLHSIDTDLPGDPEKHHVRYGIDGESKEVVVSPKPRRGTALPRPLPLLPSDTDAAIVFTAGSTGRPKGVVLKSRHFLEIAGVLSSIIGMDVDHRELILTPMTHSGGWQRVTSSLLSGGRVIIPQGILSITSILDDIQRYGVTGFFATPPLIRAFLMTSPGNIQSMTMSCRSIEIASAPLTPEELRQLISLFPSARIFFQYGLTECSRALILEANSFPEKLHTVGRPTPGVKVAIRGDDFQLLGPNEVGELLLKAKNRMGMYWQDPERNAARFRNGWFLTGDFASIDEDGFVAYRGRGDDLINCGGFSYFPAEVEAELGTPKGVKEYLIAGVPDPRGILHQVPWAFVVPQNPDAWSIKGFLETARQKLPSHMIPRRTVVLSALPLTSTGKPNRRLTVKRHGPLADPSSPSI